MIQILEIRILLPSEVVRQVDITTDEKPDDYSKSIKTELLQYGINAYVTISYRNLNQKYELPKENEK